MRLAFTLFKLFPYGGLQRDCLRLAAAGQKRGHRIDIYTLEISGKIDSPVPIQVLPARAWQNYQRYRIFSRRCGDIISRQSYDAVVGFNKMPGLDFYFAADPCYAARVAARPSWYRRLPRTRSFLRSEEAVFAPGAATEILLLAPGEQETFQHFYQTPSQRFHLLPPGIQPDRLAPPTYRQRRERQRTALGLEPGQKMLLLVGSGFKTKGLDRALRALASLPPEQRHRTVLFVAGQDNFSPFAKLAARLEIGQQVRFLGGRDDIPDLLFAADLLVHPAYRETAGHIILEAMAAELPVLTTDTCGYSHYIRQADCGCLVPSPFSQAKMNQLLLFMLSGEHRSYWQRQARQYVASHDLFDLTTRALEIIEQES